MSGGVIKLKSEIRIEKKGKGKKSNVVKAKLVAGKNTALQPEISKLAHKNKWVIWKLTEEKRHLEDVFAELTSN